MSHDITDEMVKRNFPEWRKHLLKQIANGAVFCGYQPDAETVLAMMDMIEAARNRAAAAALTSAQSSEGSNNG